MKQTDVFLHGEGDKYHERNRDKQINHSVLDAIFDLPFKPSRVLEVGCGDGRYLDAIRDRYGCKCFGIDPSASAIEEGQRKYPKIGIRRGEAMDLVNCHLGEFDLLIFGFCLYLVDRDDLPFIVAGAHRCLKPGGILAIHDFVVDRPERVPYRHSGGLYSYKMDYSALWHSNPEYQWINDGITGSDTAIIFLQKTGWEKYEGTAAVATCSDNGQDGEEGWRRTRDLSG